MSKFLRFLLLAVPVLSLGAYMAYIDSKTAISFGAEGTVVTAKWNTRNHQMSLFEIKPDKGSIKKLHHHKVTLQPEQIKVGDKFKKSPGSKSCFINEVEITCVR